MNYWRPIFGAKFARNIKNIIIMGRGNKIEFHDKFYEGGEKFVLK